MGIGGLNGIGKSELLSVMAGRHSCFPSRVIDGVYFISAATKLPQIDFISHLKIMREKNNSSQDEGLLTEE